MLLAGDRGTALSAIKERMVAPVEGGGGGAVGAVVMNLTARLLHDAGNLAGAADAYLKALEVCMVCEHQTQQVIYLGNIFSLVCSPAAWHGMAWWLVPAAVCEVESAAIETCSAMVTFSENACLFPRRSPLRFRLACILLSHVHRPGISSRRLLTILCLFADGPSPQRSLPRPRRRLPESGAAPDGLRELPAGDQPRPIGPPGLPQAWDAV